MNVTEATEVCRMVAALNPAQKFDAETPAAWAVVLRRYPKRDAMLALEAVAARQPFVQVSDLVAEIKRLRARRLEAVDVPTPNVDPADTAAYAAELRALTAAVADGRMTAEHGEAYDQGGRTLTGATPRKALGGAETARPVSQAIQGAVRAVGAP